MKRNTEDGLLGWTANWWARFHLWRRLRYVDCIFYPLVLFLSKVSIPIDLS